jgi:hypothetical protein
MTVILLHLESVVMGSADAFSFLVAASRSRGARLRDDNQLLVPFTLGHVSFFD